MANILTVARVNSVMFYLLWTCAPILVSIISFTVYVLRGNELDIPTAFTVSNDVATLYHEFHADSFSVRQLHCST